MHDALSSNLNGVHLDPLSAPDSPAVDSVATPVNNSLVPDVKIDVDYNEQESDARHEPAPIKLDKLDSASIVPQLDTPPVPGMFIPSFDAYSSLTRVKIASPSCLHPLLPLHHKPSPKTT